MKRPDPLPLVYCDHPGALEITTLGDRWQGRNEYMCGSRGGCGLTWYEVPKPPPTKIRPSEIRRRVA